MDIHANNFLKDFECDKSLSDVAELLFQLWQRTKKRSWWICKYAFKI